VKVVYPLDEVLLLATLAGTEVLTEIAWFGNNQIS
jgi:hypothetical protein